MTDAEVLVVGGGPAGASVACALARAGVDVHVVDRARFPRPKPCAEYLSPEASRLLADMGALARVAARKDLADLLIGVTGNFVPARQVTRLGYLWNAFGLSRPLTPSRAPLT